MAPDHQRLTRTQRSRLLTCLEAIDEGYSFVSRCSGCDYYIANRPLNAIAMKKERAQLSQYWQCTSVHNFGELASSVSSKTLYWPVKLSKYNCASMSCTIAASSVKRARLFSPTPNPVIVGATPSQLPTPSERIEIAATNITPVPSVHVQDSPV